MVLHDLEPFGDKTWVKYNSIYYVFSPFVVLRLKEINYSLVQTLEVVYLLKVTFLLRACAFTLALYIQLSSMVLAEFSGEIGEEVMSPSHIRIIRDNV